MFTVVGMKLVNRVGRKPLLIAGGLVMMVSMFALGFVLPTSAAGGHMGLEATIATLVLMVTYVAGFAATWGWGFWVLASELYPTKVRAPLGSFTLALVILVNLGISYSFPVVLGAIGGQVMWCFAAMSLLGIGFVWKFVPETNGRTLEEIELYWRRLAGRIPSRKELRVIGGPS